MATLALTPVAVQKINDLLLTLITATETAVLETPLEPCYRGTDGAEPVDVTLDATGSASLPLGASIEIQVKRIDPSTGNISDVPSNTTIDANAKTTVTIAAGNHQVGVGSGCVNYLLYIVAVYPSGDSATPRKKVLLVETFLICDRCPVIPSPGDDLSPMKKS